MLIMFYTKTVTFYLLFFYNIIFGREKHGQEQIGLLMLLQYFVVLN